MEQRKEEDDNLLKEPTGQRKEEEEGNILKEPTDQRREDEEDGSEEPAPRCSEEPADPRKEVEAEAEAERSSDEESESASTLFVHPCSLLRYLARAFACCLGMPDSFGGPGTAKRSAGVAAPASVDSTREGGEADRSIGATATTVSGFYMQGVVTRVFAVRRPRPPSGNPREGSGGNGGHHH